MTVQCGRQRTAYTKKDSLVTSKLHPLQDGIHRMLKKKRGRGGEVEGRKKGKKGGKEKEKYYIHVCLNKHRLELEQYIKNGNMLPLGKLNGRKTELEIFLSITFVPFDFVACEYIIILKQNKTPFNSKSFNVKS